jgi:hypothetical protein
MLPSSALFTVDSLPLLKQLELVGKNKTIEYMSLLLVNIKKSTMSLQQLADSNHLVH